jgi:hypothetical protein
MAPAARAAFDMPAAVPDLTQSGMLLANCALVISGPYFR